MTGTTMGFGGPWTKEKLDILERYLDAYTTALKNQPFGLVYIDAFAGTGAIGVDGCGISDRDSDSFVMGSTRRALRITDRPFDRLVFVEKQSDRYDHLMHMRARYPERLIDVKQEDANTFLSSLRKASFRGDVNHGPYSDWRGVLFLDPFGTEVAWSTIERIARLERLDTWLLLPVGAIGRMLPLAGRGKSPFCETFVNELN